MHQGIARFIFSIGTNGVTNGYLGISITGGCGVSFPESTARNEQHFSKILSWKAVGQSRKSGRMKHTRMGFKIAIDRNNDYNYTNYLDA